MHLVFAGVGSLVFHTYTVLVDTGILLSLAWLYLASPAEGEASGRWLEAGLAGAFGGLIGARATYVAANWPYYVSHVPDGVRIWEGGLAWPGGVVGAALGILAYGRVRDMPVAPVFDALALPVPLLSGLAWAGCAASACAAGRVVAPGELPAWLAVDWPDLYGVVAPRWPTQALGTAWSLVALTAMWLTRRRPFPPGARLALAVGLIALGAFALGWTRGDPMPAFGVWRADAIASGIVFVGAGLSLMLAAKTQRHQSVVSLQPSA